MRKKTSNLKTVVHFSLAIGLIVGIWMMSNSGTSNYKNSGKVADVKKPGKVAEESVIIKESTIASMRTTFDCKDTEQVKFIQKELNLTADGSAKVLEMKVIRHILHHPQK